jgi:hypothetical protein
MVANLQRALLQCEAEQFARQFGRNSRGSLAQPLFLDKASPAETLATIDPQERALCVELIARVRNLGWSAARDSAQIANHAPEYPSAADPGEQVEEEVTTGESETGESETGEAGEVGDVRQAPDKNGDWTDQEQENEDGEAPPPFHLQVNLSLHAPALTTRMCVEGRPRATDDGRRQDVRAAHPLWQLQLGRSRRRPGAGPRCQRARQGPADAAGRVILLASSGDQIRDSLVVFKSFFLTTHPSFTRLSPVFHPSFTRLSPVFHPSFTQLDGATGRHVFIANAVGLGLNLSESSPTSLGYLLGFPPAHYGPSTSAPEVLAASLDDSAAQEARGQTHVAKAPSPQPRTRLSPTPLAGIAPPVQFALGPGPEMLVASQGTWQLSDGSDNGDSDDGADAEEV